MRWTLVVFAATVFAAYVAGAAEPAAPTSAQEGTVAAATAPSAPAAQAPAAAPEAPAPATASEPPAAAAAEASATPAAGADAAAPANGGGSQPITLSVPAVPPPDDFKVPSGYRPQKNGLETVYCTTITPIGSRMPQKYCLTRQQVELVQEQAEMARRDKAKTGTCAGGGCGGS